MTKEEHNTGIRWLCEGRLWRDKINGNTYHSYLVTDVKTRKTLISQGLSYGGKSMIQQNVKRDLIKLGLLRDEDRHNHELTRGWYYWTYADVLQRNMFKTTFALRDTVAEKSLSEEKKIKQALEGMNGKVRSALSNG